MNRNLFMATTVALGVLAGASTAVAQYDDVIQCIDPTSTSSPYSNDFNFISQYDDLMGITVGLAGTVNFSKVCFPPNGITLHTAGRIGFYGGPVGSVQDTAYGGQPIDNGLLMTFGGLTGVSGNYGYAVTERQDVGATTRTRTAFGKNAIDEYFSGASDRYFVVGSTNDNIRITLRVDTLGDTNRLQWTLSNQGVAANIGLDFGQWVYLESPGNPIVSWPPGNPLGTGSNFVDVPGYKPVTTDHRFARDTTDQTVNDPEFPTSPIPANVNFGITQSHAYGLSIPLSATPAIPDQTPVDIIDIGKIGIGWLLGGNAGDDTPMPRYDFKSPKPLLGDTSFGTFGSYVQRWFQKPVAAGESRVINAYYRTTWGVSDYDRPYSAVVDTPKVVGVDPADPNVFTTNPMVVRVYIDNTRGFSTVDKAVALNDVRVTLNLPQGMSDAADTTHTKVKLVKTISRVMPQNMNFVDFQVYVDPTTYGLQQYTVKIEPNPGAVKTISGTINVASQPYLLVRNTANLVAAPWQFSSSNWNSILNTGTNPLVPDIDYQAYEWNASTQSYVVQSGPRRGFGTFLISNKDVGYKALGGNPSAPPDLTQGADLISLKPGWNLIANPYNYSIPVGQLVGVSDADPRNSLSFEEMANSNIINSSLAYWDLNTQSYKFTVGNTDLLIPNRGYWIYVSSPSNLTLSFPAVFAAFIPVQPDNPDQFTAQWQLQLTAKTSRVTDDQNFIGASANAGIALRGRAMKPPIAPTASAISASFVEKQGSKTIATAKSYQGQANHEEWTWQVLTRTAGNVTVSWPVPKGLPTGTKLTITDLATNRTYDMSQVQSMTYIGRSNSAHQFRIVADKDVLPPGPVLGTVTAQRTAAGSTAPFAIKYQLAYSANTTVRILRGTTEYRVVTKDLQETGGAKTVQWNLKDASGRTAPKGSYTVEVTAKNTGRTPETKTVFVFLY